MPDAASAAAAGRTDGSSCLAAGKAAGSMAEVAERTISTRSACRPAASRARGDAPRLRPPDHAYPGHRSRPSDPGRNRPGRRARHAGARRKLRAPTISCWCCSPAAHRPTGSRRPPGLTLAEKQAVTRALLRCGASIGEINTVRKHLSALKGGRLAALAAPARVVTLAISDVPGDDPAVIGSGPSVPDPTTLADARAVDCALRARIAGRRSRARSNDPANESPKPDDPAFANTEFR